MVKAGPKKSNPAGDSAYFLKILVYFVLGMVWIKINGYVVIPIGLVVGLIIAQHDHFAIDRKIEYAVLIVSAILGLSGYGAFLGFWIK
jgi:hypothetical protein